MHLKNIFVFAAIIELALLTGTSAIPALASEAGVPDPAANLPNNTTTPSSVAVPDSSQQSPNTEATNQGSTPNNSISPKDGGTPASVVTPDNSQKSDSIQNNPRSPLGVPYWSNGNICREQGEDMMCFTPQVASKLRWPIPTSQLLR